jgi:hypothetical protein
LRSVKPEHGSKPGPIIERLATLLKVFSPWEGISLTYRQFAAEIGAPVTEAAVKKWPQRKKFPADVARAIVARARERGLVGVTLEWVLWGDGPRPQKAPNTTQNVPTSHPSRLPKVPEGQRVSPPAAPSEPHGQLPARIARALEADLNQNELGQWSSAEVQHTVIWGLKDLARRLWVLRFSMGETFALTDDWAGKIGLPVRPPDPSSNEGNDSTASSVTAARLRDAHNRAERSKGQSK